MSEHKGRVWGYARVSSTDQNLDRQREVLDGVDTLIEEKMSGKERLGREKLNTLMEFANAGDVVRVKSADRLARSTRDLLDILDELKAKGVGVEFIDNPALNTNSPQGKFMLTILGAVAELERETIRERQAEGIALAKKGTYDRAPKLSKMQIREAKEKVDAGVPKAKIARDLGISRATLYAALNGTGKYSDRP